MFNDVAKSRRIISLSILAVVLFILQLTNIAVDKVSGREENHPKAETQQTDSETSIPADDIASVGDVVITPSEDEVKEDENIVIPLVVSAASPIGEEFVPDNLVYIGDGVKGNSSLQINSTVLDAYKVMYADIKADGVELPMIISAYRSYSRQKTLYDNKVAQYGPDQTLTAKPGTSEHQYSGCIDLSTDGTCQNNFGELAVGKWIAENCHKYGFIIRYPSEKKDITGISFEPWHIRYVGVKHASAMRELDMCLEEYVDFLKKKYPDAPVETSPSDYPAPRWAGDTEGQSPATVSESDVSSGDVSSADAV